MRRVACVAALVASLGVCDDCGLEALGSGPCESCGLVAAHQAAQIAGALAACEASGTPAGGVVRSLRSGACPKSWAVTCLDHFNCGAILRDVSDPLVEGLRALGAADVVAGTLSHCLATVPDCGDRQHLVLNGNLANASHAAALPRGSVLANLGAGNGRDVPNFKGSHLGRFPLVSADSWTSDQLSERARSVGAVSETRARGIPTLKRR